MPLSLSKTKMSYEDIMMTSSNGNIFRVTDPLCGEFTGHRWIPLTKASDAKLWWFHTSALNKQLSKQSRHRWVETPSRSLWRHCNVMTTVWGWREVVTASRSHQQFLHSFNSHSYQNKQPIYIYLNISRNCSVMRYTCRSIARCFGYKHIEAETKWPSFRSRHFQMNFLEWKRLNFK